MWRTSTRAAPRRFGLTELILAILALSVFFALVAIKKLEEERDEWKDRLYMTLKSTSDAARASEKRLRQAVELLKEGEGDNANLYLIDKLDSSNTKPDSFSIDLPIGDNHNNYFEVNGKTTVILFCYSRADYLKRTLQSLSSRLDSAINFRKNGLRVIISQDGYDGSVREVSQQFASEMNRKGINAEHIQHVRTDSRDKGHMASYYALSAHYNKGLDYAFRDGSKRAIILEDDLDLAIDFFPYFEAFSGLLEEDESLLAVSAWNDHGQVSFVSDPRRLYRTDVFPGLGWMLSDRVWQELRPKWPLAFWDDWLREPAQRKGRHVIRPEISRTTTFGASGGASQGQFFDKFLRTMKLNDVNVRFTKAEIEAMRKQAFDDSFMRKVQQARQVDSPAQIPRNSQEEYRLLYTSVRHFINLAPSLGIMDDVKAGSPRGAYRGILPIAYQNTLLYIVPQNIPSLD